MGEVKSHTFYRTFVLVSILMFLVSLETAAKQDKSVVTGGTLTKKGKKLKKYLFLLIVLDGVQHRVMA